MEKQSWVAQADPVAERGGRLKGKSVFVESVEKMGGGGMTESRAERPEVSGL